MGLLTHLVLFAAYALGAAAVAFGLPDAAPDVGKHLAHALGGCVFLAAALLHEVLARRMSQTEMKESVQEGRRVTLDLERDIDNIREDVARLGGTGAGIIAGDSATTSHAELVQEMRVLQGLVTRLEAGATGGADPDPTRDSEEAPAAVEATAPAATESSETEEASPVGAPTAPARQVAVTPPPERLPARRRHRPRPFSRRRPGADTGRARFSPVSRGAKSLTSPRPPCATIESIFTCNRLSRCRSARRGSTRPFLAFATRTATSSCPSSTSRSPPTRA